MVSPGGESPRDELDMYGLIEKLEAAESKRDALVDLLKEVRTGLPGCVSYVVAPDIDDPNSIWVTEVWKSEEDHAASLMMPRVKAAIDRARPIIAGMTRIAETRPS